MTKLPVGETTIDAIKFGLSNMFTTIRLGWVGLVLSIVIAGIVGLALSSGIDFSIFESLDDLDGSDFEDSAEAIHTIGMLYAVLFACIVVASIAFVPLTVILSRMAAGVESAPGGIGYFRFGGTELLYVAGSILVFFLYTIVSVLSFLPAIVSFGWAIFTGVEAGEAALDNSMVGLTGALGILFLLLGAVLVIWFALRMITFMPQIAAEGRVGLPSALGSTKGNVWRILGACILFILMLYVAEIIFTIGFVVIVLICVFLYQAAAAASEALGVAVIAFGGLIGFGAFILYLMFAIAASTGFPAIIYKKLRQN